eukprot:700636-Pyramimonas_sp.AAC.1
MVNVPETVCDTMSECHGAAGTLILCIENQERLSGTIEDRQDATVTVIRGVEIPGIVSWQNSGCSIGCLPTGHFPQ